LGVRLEWDGKPKDVESLSLPFQTVEIINESRATRERDSGALFGAATGVRERNQLIWSDDKLVMSSLIQKFAGQVNRSGVCSWRGRYFRVMCLIVQAAVSGDTTHRPITTPENASQIERCRAIPSMFFLLSRPLPRARSVQSDRSEVKSSRPLQRGCRLPRPRPPTAPSCVPRSTGVMVLNGSSGSINDALAGLAVEVLAVVGTDFLHCNGVPARGGGRGLLAHPRQLPPALASLAQKRSI
jgi:hypothetical protein